MPSASGRNHLERDLADLDFVDTAGLRASRPVWRLLGVLGWDDLPGLVLEEAL